MMSTPPETPSSGSSPSPTPPPHTPSTPATPGEFKVSATVGEMLRQTKPWVRFMSILGFIASGLMIVGGLIAMLGSMASQRFELIGMGAVYIFLSLIYIVPSVFLTQYANQIASLLRTGAEQDLERALDRQRAFWKFVGILMIVVLCLYLAIFVIWFLAWILQAT